jgi:hypothetical protein
MTFRRETMDDFFAEATVYDVPFYEEGFGFCFAGFEGAEGADEMAFWVAGGGIPGIDCDENTLVEEKMGSCANADFGNLFG